MSAISDARAAVRRARTQLGDVALPEPLRAERTEVMRQLDRVEAKLTELLNERNELARAEVTP